MKKILIYFMGFILICFILPAICTKTVEVENLNTIAKEEIEVQKTEEKEETPNREVYDYREFNIIKLLHMETGEIEESHLDEYLIGVVSAEMPASYEIDALKAQAIVARTYTIYQIKNNGAKHEGANICDSYACCQAWISKDERLAKWEEGERETNWQKIVQAVNETSGEIITYDGQPINAFFHSG